LLISTSLFSLSHTQTHKCQNLVSSLLIRKRLRLLYQKTSFVVYLKPVFRQTSDWLHAASAKPTERKAGWAPEAVWTSRKIKKKSLCLLPVLEPRSLVTSTTAIVISSSSSGKGLVFVVKMQVCYTRCKSATQERPLSLQNILID
jgi:hypothetical protein